MSEPFHGVGLELGDAGPCPTITYKDKVWSVGHPTQRAKAQLEGLAAQVAMRNVEEMRDFYSAQQYKEEVESVRSAIRGGHHKTWGSLWMTVNNGPESNMLFLLSLLRERHPEAMLADAEGMWADVTEDAKTAMAMVVPSFYALLVKSLPGSPEERTELLARSIEQFLESLKLRPLSPVQDSKEATTC